MNLKCIAILLIVVLSASAQNAKLMNLESLRKKAMEEIEITANLLNQTSNSKKNALSRLNLLLQQIESRKEVITLLNREIESMDKEIAAVEKEIKTLESELKYKKDNYVKSLQRMSFHKNGQDKLLFILAGDDFSQSYRRMRYLKEYAGWQKKQGVEISAKQTELEKQNQQLVASKNEKLVLVQQKENEDNNLKKEENKRQTEIKTLTAKEKDLKKELDKKRKQAAELNRQIEKSIAEEITRINKEAEKANRTNETQNKRQITSTEGFAMTKAERQLSSNFESNKGKLPYPLKGQYKITSRFGLQKPEGLRNVILNSNGIDIQTTPGNEAKSIFGGEVSKIFVVPGYNSSVIVRHGNYLTVYCNLSEVYVKTNEKVKTGQTLGKIFSDREDGNTTVLHFELWKEKTKLNPESWLLK